MPFVFSNSRKANAGINRPAIYRGFIGGKPAPQNRARALLPAAPEVMTFSPGHDIGYTSPLHDALQRLQARRRS